jgi:hypothetical protein
MTSDKKTIKLSKRFKISLSTLRKGIGRSVTDCFVVPPRNDTFFLGGGGLGSSLVKGVSEVM